MFHQSETSQKNTLIKLYFNTIPFWQIANPLERGLWFFFILLKHPVILCFFMRNHYICYRFAKKTINSYMIKVLEVIRQGHVGGGESHLLDLVMGFDTDLISPVVLSFTSGKMIDALRACGVKCYVIPTEKPFDMKVLNVLKKLICDENIRLIHAHGSRAASNVLLLAGMLHIPLVYTVHGWSFHQDQPWLIRKLRAVSEKIICNRSKKVICVSANNKVSGEKEFGLKHAVVIENGINVRRFNPLLPFRDVRPELGIPPDDFIIGFIGRVTLQKSPLVFVESIALAHALDSRIKGLMVGEGEMDGEVAWYINDRHWGDIIYKVPFRSDIPEVLASINVFCLPSLWEGFSISLLEAMSMGKPLVVNLRMEHVK